MLGRRGGSYLIHQYLSIKLKRQHINTYKNDEEGKKRERNTVSKTENHHSLRRQQTNKKGCLNEYQLVWGTYML
jgi:hypothetical protein